MKPIFDDFKREILAFADEVINLGCRADNEVFPSTTLQTIIRDIPTIEFLGIEQGLLTYQEFFKIPEDLDEIANTLANASIVCNETTVMIYALAYINVCLDDSYARDKIELLVKYLCKR